MPNIDLPVRFCWLLHLVEVTVITMILFNININESYLLTWAEFWRFQSIWPGSDFHATHKTDGWNITKCLCWNFQSTWKLCMKSPSIETWLDSDLKSLWGCFEKKKELFSEGRFKLFPKQYTCNNVIIHCKTLLSYVENLEETIQILCYIQVSLIKNL